MLLLTGMGIAAFCMSRNGISCLQCLESPLCRLEHLLRHTRKARHMKTEAMGHSTLHQLAEEDDVLAHLLDRNMIVLHAVINIFKIVKFMIMSREQSLGTVAVLMDILHYGAGYGHTVICRCSSSDLVQKHERTGRQIVQDHRRLEHLDHEGRLAAGYVIRRTYTGEDLVAPADLRFCSRHETSYLSHQHDQRSLTQKRGLTGHIRTSQDNHLLASIVKIYVIRNEFLSHLHHGLDHRMAALLYVYDLAVIHLRTAVSVA